MVKLRGFVVAVIMAFCCAAALQPQELFLANASGAREVYLGGYPVSIELYSEGPIVRAVTENYAVGGEIRVGDVIKEINGISVGNRSELYEVVSDKTVAIPMTVTLLRNDNITHVSFIPDRDECSDKLKLGFQTKDGISGLGTVTCVTGDGVFHALGHPISDSDSTSRFTCRTGSIYKCEVSGIQRPAQGKAGRLIGKCVDNRNAMGSVSVNTDFGLKGGLFDTVSGQRCETVPSSLVKPGKAQVLTTIRSEPCFYDIEIVKASRQNSPSEKGMIIKITDETLLKNTGGILQGMSGSPILQNGKLVGAVTHVFTNDPTRGYGTYIDWILSA